MEVRVEVAPDGGTTIDVSGVVGKGCENITASLQRALGATEVDAEHKPEYYEHATDKVNA